MVKDRSELDPPPPLLLPPVPAPDPFVAPLPSSCYIYGDGTDTRTLEEFNLPPSLGLARARSANPVRPCARFQAARECVRKGGWSVPDQQSHA